MRHPVGVMMSHIAQLQHSYSGDGTCSAIMLCGSLLSEARRLIFSKGIHPNMIIQHLVEASNVASEQLEKIKINLLPQEIPMNDQQALLQLQVDPKEDLLNHIALSTLSTKVMDINAAKVLNSYKVAYLYKDISRTCVSAIRTAMGVPTVQMLKTNRFSLSDLTVVPVVTVEVNKEEGTAYLINGLVIDQGVRRTVYVINLYSQGTMICHIW
jgi:chaperonin GroEL (HSP60 family)